MDFEAEFIPLLAECWVCGAAFAEAAACPDCGACTLCWQPAGRHSATFHYLAARARRERREAEAS